MARAKPALERATSGDVFTTSEPALEHAMSIRFSEGLPD
jgi:hypothetical protein